MLHLPTGSQPGRRSGLGVVPTSSQGTPVLRRLAFPVQRAGSAAANWRAQFLTAKQNFAALSSSALAAWATQNDSYGGIRQPRDIARGGVLGAPLIGCQTTEAYFVMCQTNRAALGLSPITTPTGPGTYFSDPMSMNSAALYDSSYNLAGFVLNYNLFPHILDYAYSGSTPIPVVWQVTASRAYTAAKTAPGPDSWSPILYTGHTLPWPSEVLAAWITIFGPLPDAGHIKFQLRPIDPVTGSAGVPLSSTCTWKQLTLTGSDPTVWAGPDFFWSTVATESDITPPGSAALTFALTGINAYAGTIYLDLTSPFHLTDGYNSTRTGLPPGLTYSLSPSTLTIPAGSSTPLSATLTLTVAADAPFFDNVLRIRAKDGIHTHSASFPVRILASMRTVIPANFLDIWFTIDALTVPYPAATYATLNLSNSGPDTIPLSLAWTSTDPGISIAFDTDTFLLPPASPYTTATLPLTDPLLTATSGGGSATYVATDFLNGDFTGYYLTVADASPSDYNGGPWPILSNDERLITVAASFTDYAPATGGTITITDPDHINRLPAPSLFVPNPSRALATLTLTRSADPALPSRVAVITASAGLNTTNTGLLTS